MTNPYGPAGGNDPQQWGQQPYPGTPSGSFPQQGGGFGQPAPGGYDPNAGQYGQPGQYGGYDPNAGPHSGGFGAPGQPYGGYPQQPQPGFDPNSGQYGQPGQFGAPPQQAQYGQPGQFGAPQQPQQFGAPGQQFGGFPPQQGFDPNQQYGQYPGFPAGQAPKKSKMPLLIGGGAAGVLLVIVLVGGFVWPGFFQSTVFDQGKLQDGVKKILTEQYRITGVSGVTCPSGQKVSAGSTFDCQVTVGGQQKQVVITVKNAQGVYEVAKPS